MDNHLLDKEVLCILDTRQIQRFIFHSNSMRDAIGGGLLVSHILPDAILNALSTLEPGLGPDEYDLNTDPDAEIPYFTGKHVQFQLMTCAAGNAMFLARTGELAGKVIRKTARYYLEHAYSLNLTAAAVEKTGDMAADIFNLYQKLNAVKASAEMQEPLGTLPVCIPERKTGDPVVTIDRKNGEYISESSLLRRAESDRQGKIPDLQMIHTTTASDRKEYRAVIHADGNNLGITIGRILAAACSYEEGIRIRRKINRDIEQNYAGIVRKTLGELEQYYTEVLNGNDFKHEIQVVNRAGDDINCICNANLVFPFLILFFNNLKGCMIWDSGGISVPLYDCAGVAFVTKTHDFHTAFQLAEACCGNAKKTAKLDKNLRDGLAGNWVDFYVSEHSGLPDLEALRETYYVTREGSRLLVRPYCLDPEAEGTPVSFALLIERMLKIQELSSDKGLELMHSYLMEKAEFWRWTGQMKKKGIDLTKILGAPFFEDKEKNRYFSWYDPAELSDFIPSGMERLLK